MKILYLTPIFPDLRTGGGRRSLTILNSLARHGTVTVVCQSMNPAEIQAELASLRTVASTIIVIGTRTNRLSEKRAAKPTLRTRLASVMAREPWRVHDAFSRAFYEAVSSLSPTDFDLIVVRLDMAAQYVFKQPTARALMAKTVIDIDDVAPRILSRIIKELPRGYPRARHLLEAFLTWHFYRQMRRVAACLVCSELDRSYVQAQGFAKRVFVVPNVVEVNGLHESAVPRDGVPMLFFGGALDYRPNQDAAVWFCERVFPQIQRACPRACVVIAGRNPSERVRRLGELPGVTMAGSVPSFAPFYEAATVVVAPLLNGGGTRIKILEAMAYGKPVVSTSVGCEGIEVRDGEHLAIADEPSAFVQRCVELLEHPEQRAAMAKRAHAFVKECYDTTVLDRRLDEVLAWYRNRKDEGEPCQQLA